MKTLRVCPNYSAKAKSWAALLFCFCIHLFRIYKIKKHTEECNYRFRKIGSAFYLYLYFYMCWILWWIQTFCWLYQIHASISTSTSLCDEPDRISQYLANCTQFTALPLSLPQTQLLYALDSTVNSYVLLIIPNQWLESHFSPCWYTVYTNQIFLCNSDTFSFSLAVSRSSDIFGRVWFWMMCKITVWCGTFWSLSVHSST